MRCNTVEPDFIYFCDISSFKKEVIYSSSVEMMEKEV
jgi:hypothetical protein